MKVLNSGKTRILGPGLEYSRVVYIRESSVGEGREGWRREGVE